MVTCKHCSTPNTLDSAFCKRCGTALPEDEVLESKEKLDALIKEGNTSFNEGRTDEALEVAVTALESFPTHTNALALKSMCHERKGDLAEALECAERIVELNPDSELDKIKRNQLRNKLAISAQLATPEPDRKGAMIGALSAVVLVVCIGILIARLTSKKEPVVSNTPQPKIETVIPNQPVQQSVQNQQQPTQTNNPPSNAKNLQDGAVGGLTTNEGENPVGIISPDVFTGNGLPQTGRGSGTVTPEPPDSGTRGSKSSGGNVARPTQSGGNGSGGSEAGIDPTPPSVNATEEKKDDPGQIEIKVSDAGKRSNLGGSESVTTGGASALARVGMQRFQLGQYGPAAATFEQAIRAGGDQMSLYQRLGQCYDNLGKKNEAADAYKRGIAACQAALANGSGNRESIQKRLDICQQALKVLQGN